MNCEECGQPLDTDDPRARYHGPCRQAAYRRRKRGASVTERRPRAPLNETLGGLLRGRSQAEAETAEHLLGSLHPERRARLEDRISGEPRQARSARSCPSPPGAMDLAGKADGVMVYCGCGALHEFVVVEFGRRCAPRYSPEAERARGRYANWAGAWGPTIVVAQPAPFTWRSELHFSGDVSMQPADGLVAIRRSHLLALEARDRQLEAGQARGAQVQLAPPSSGAWRGVALLGGVALALVAGFVALQVRAGVQVPNLGLPDVAEAPLTLAQVARYA